MSDNPHDKTRSTTGFKEHQVLLCLNKQLYRAFIRLQADKNLGRSYAGMLPYVEGLYRLGYISQEVYELHFRKYSEPLEPMKPLSVEEQQKENELESHDRIFKGMLEQWDAHASDAEWLLRVSRSAEKYRDCLDSARKLLVKIDARTCEKSTSPKETCDVVSLSEEKPKQ